MILALLILSAIGELFGTATVAVNYARGAAVARELRAEMAGEGRPQAVGPNPSYDESQMTPERVDQASAALFALRERVSNLLRADPLLVAGLIALAIGAVAGLAAGIIALNYL
ncbi:MAG TPA: hypothetical protein VII76_05605 [Acidimicrobiales bacterium]